MMFDRFSLARYTNIVMIGYYRTPDEHFIFFLPTICIAWARKHPEPPRFVQVPSNRIVTEASLPQDATQRPPIARATDVSRVRRSRMKTRRSE